MKDFEFVYIFHETGCYHHELQKFFDSFVTIMPTKLAELNIIP